MPTDDLDAIKHLDFAEVRCQCQQQACKGGCPEPAVMQVKFHALDHCDGSKDDDGELDADGNYTFLLCLSCLGSLMIHVARHLAELNTYGLYTCQTCGAPAKSTKPDMFREVTRI